MQRLLAEGARQGAMGPAPTHATAAAAAAALNSALAALLQPAARPYAQAATVQQQAYAFEAGAAAPRSRSRRRSSTSSSSSSRDMNGSATNAAASTATTTTTTGALKQLLGQPCADKLQQWQQLARLSPAAAQQLLREQPRLRALLTTGPLHPSNMLVNLACLSLRASELEGDQHALLRGLLALLPPSMVQECLSASAPQPPHNPRRQIPSRLQMARQLQDHLMQALGPARAPPRATQQPQPPQPPPCGPAGSNASAAHGTHEGLLWRGQAWHAGRGVGGQHSGHHHQQQQQQQQQQHIQRLAEAVVRALNMQPTAPLNEDMLPRAVQADLRSARVGSSSSSSASASGHEQLHSHGSSGSARSSSPARAFTTNSSAAGLTVSQGLMRVLERTARSGVLRRKPLHEPAVAAQLAQQLVSFTGGDAQAALQVLLRRPVFLWQHMTPQTPRDVLGALQRLLPSTPASPASASASSQQGQPQQPQPPPGQLLALVRALPALLSCSAEQLGGVDELLLGRLALGQEQVGRLLRRCPRLLLAPPKAMSANVGFLVGLGLRQGELRGMLLTEPRWLLTPLRDLSVQWHFVQTVLKVRCARAFCFFLGGGGARTVNQAHPRVMGCC
jgi:hypothetical protein